MAFKFEPIVEADGTVHFYTMSGDSYRLSPSWQNESQASDTAPNSDHRPVSKIELSDIGKAVLCGGDFYDFKSSETIDDKSSSVESKIA